MVCGVCPPPSTYQYSQRGFRSLVSWAFWKVGDPSPRLCEAGQKQQVSEHARKIKHVLLGRASGSTNLCSLHSFRQEHSTHPYTEILISLNRTL